MLLVLPFLVGWRANFGQVARVFMSLAGFARTTSHFVIIAAWANSQWVLVLRLADSGSMIGQHLSDAIRTGAHCSYEPATDAPFEWADHSPAGLYE